MNSEAVEIPKLEDKILVLEDVNKKIQNKYASSQEENHRLKSELAWCRKQIFGSKSEKSPKAIDQNQLTLFNKKESDKIDDADIKISEDVSKLTSEVPKSPLSIEGDSEDATSKRNGRRTIPENIETEEEIIPVNESQKIDKYGEKLVLLGYDEYEQFIRIPGKIIRKVYKRERWGYKDTRETKATANVKNSIVKRGKYGDPFIHETVFQKFYMGMPLYRQMDELNMQGAELSRSSMSDVIKNFAYFYGPITQAIRNSILKSPFLHADETPVTQLTLGGKVRGYMWAFKDQNQIYYSYAPSRAGKVAEEFFFPPENTADGPPKTEPDPGTAIFIEYLMTDGYAPYNQVANLLNATRMNCWAHARRKFYNASHSNEEAKEIVLLIDDLYRIERKINVQAFDEGWSYFKLVKERHSQRQTASKEVIDTIERRMTEIQVYATPKSTLGKACSYCIKNLKAQKVYLKDGRLPIDNNTVERSIRPIAVGRKNYLFVGSEDAGQWAAICYTIVENCRMNKIDPRKYMDHVTKQIHKQGRDDAEYDLLTPTAIADQNIL